MYGRRKVFIVTMVIIACFVPSTPTFSTNFWILLAGLTLMGLGVGADLPVSLATIAEAAKDSNRGKMLVFTQVMWIAASLTTIIIATATGGLGRLSGQILYGMIVVVAVIGLALRLTVPESPLWLQSRDERRRGVHTVRADKARVRDLLQAPYRRPFIVLSVFYALELPASTILGGFTTYVAVNVAGLGDHGDSSVHDRADPARVRRPVPVHEVRGTPGSGFRCSSSAGSCRSSHC